ncbi:MAG: HemK/PrmC family methyltransferase [Vampirovibrionales bacterium]|nr:HemK/PrmC family methyltransferase [Vampirovibrionales bacterium]
MDVHLAQSSIDVLETKLVGLLTPVAGSKSAAAAEARWMLEALLACSRAQLLMMPPAQRLSPRQAQVLTGWLAQRVLGRKPLQYILGEAPFLSSVLAVSPAVLIPRPETEGLAQLVINAFKNNSLQSCSQGLKAPSSRLCYTIADVCTGSGVLAIALKQSLGERAQVYATDLSAPALCIARQNSEKYKLDIQFRLGNMLWALPQDKKFDTIVCNPPYIGLDEALLPEVHWHEPAMALFSDDPLAYYRHLAYRATDFLLPGGQLWLELNAANAQAIKTLFVTQPGWHTSDVLPDMYAMPRYLRAVRATHS